MLNPQTAASGPSSAIRWRLVLAYTLAGLALVVLGFWMGWDSAMESEPVRFSFECERPAAI